MNKKYKYKISIVMPVYKVEKYIEESIKSLINQTINFKKNVQLIMINDGSPDNSEKICLKYKEKYPNNIIYIKKENGGVSSARNEGIKYIEGKYVNFLDSDDKWPRKALKKAYDIFEKYNDVVLVSFRQKYFEAITNYTSLDYKYKKGDIIVDYKKDYQYIQLSVTSAFLRSNLINNNLYDTKIKYSEDAKFIYDYLFSCKDTKLAMISSIPNLYRKRKDETSAIQAKDKRDDWYFITTERSYKYVLEKSKEVFKKVIAYAQYYIAYEYQFRSKVNLANLLDDAKFYKYLAITNNLFKDIDDNIIIEQKNVNNFIKNINLIVKYNSKNIKRFEVIKNNLSEETLNKYINGTLNANIDIFEYKNKNINIEGHFDIIENNNLKFYYKDSTGKKIRIKTFKRIMNLNNFINGKIYAPGYKITIDLNKLNNFSFICELGNKSYEIPIICNNLSKISNINNTYLRIMNKIVFIKNNKIKVIENKKLILKELKLLFSLLKNRKLKVLLLRFMYLITKPFITKKDIWIISDRYEVAGDNGQVLFEYINKNNYKNIKSYFVISKNSKDKKYLNKIGKVIYYKSLKYRLLFLNAKYIISSHCEKYTINIVGNNIAYFSDIQKFKFIFLQHGIIMNDLSSWLNKYNKNINLFITSVQSEYNSILKENYYYDESVVKLTGLPRFDKLISNNKLKNKILILPTWRSYLSGDIIKGTQIRNYNSNFKESDYFKFYNNLINDKELIKVLKRYNYKIKFAIHPSHALQIIDFKENSRVKISNNIIYSEEFKSSKLLITDYSSVMFDFAYLKRPILYSQFDKEEFFERHFLNEGYYDYKKDGFGEVIYDYKRLISRIIHYIENDCKIEKKYLKKINKFYKYYDQNNCKRVFKEINNLSKDK